MVSILRYLPVILVRRASAVRLASLAVLALALRLVYILLVAPAPVGVGGDAGFYHSAANLIAHGHFLYRTIFGHAHPTAEHPPLFALVLAVVSLCGGDSLLAHRVVGCVIGSLAVVLISLLARRVAGTRAGWVAGVLAAMYPPLITADGLVMSEPLFVLGVAAALLLAINVRSGEGHGVREVTLLGLVLGLCTLTRGEGLLLLPLLGWPVALVGARRARWRRLAAVTVAVALTLAPWVIRNLAVFGRPLLAADSNTVIAGANCPQTYYGHDLGWWSLRCLAEARTHQQLLQGDASTATALRYARGHLSRLPVVGAVRVLRTFDLFQPLRQGNHERRRRWVDIAGLAFFFPLLALAVVGLLRRRGLRRELLAPVAMVVIVSGLGWGIGRFRVAADVSLLVLSAEVLSAASPTTRRRRRSSPPPARSSAPPAR